MKISQTTNLSKISNTNQTSINQNFDEILKSEIRYAKLENDMQDKIKAFKSSLSSLGAFGYLSSLNEQKIDEKIEQKRVYLEEVLGLNRNKTQDEKEQILALISDLLSEYKHKLQEQTKQNNTINEKQNELNKVATFTNIADLINKL